MDLHSWHAHEEFAKGLGEDAGNVSPHYISSPVSLPPFLQLYNLS